MKIQNTGFQPTAGDHICYVCTALKIAHRFMLLGITLIFPPAQNNACSP